MLRMTQVDEASFGRYPHILRVFSTGEHKVFDGKQLDLHTSMLESVHGAITQRKKKTSHNYLF